MKNKLMLFTILFGVMIGFSGCLPKREPVVETPAMKLQEEAGLSQEQMKAQELSDQDDLETLEVEAQGTVFLDEEFADLE